MKHRFKSRGAIAVIFSIITFFFVIFFMGTINVMYVELMKTKAKNALQNYQLLDQDINNASLKAFVDQAIPGCSLTEVTIFTKDNITAVFSCNITLPFVDSSPTFKIQQTRS